MFEQSWRATPQSISVLRVPDGRSKASERAVGKVSSGSRYVQQIIYLTVFWWNAVQGQIFGDTL